MPFSDDFNLGRQNSLFSRQDSLSCQNNSLFCGVGKSRRKPYIGAVICSRWTLPRPHFRKIPCSFPCYQGIGGGDGFDLDCVRHHAVRISSGHRAFARKARISVPCLTWNSWGIQRGRKSGMSRQTPENRTGIRFLFADGRGALGSRTDCACRLCHFDAWDSGPVRTSTFEVKRMRCGHHE